MRGWNFVIVWTIEKQAIWCVWKCPDDRWDRKICVSTVTSGKTGKICKARHSVGWSTIYMPFISIYQYIHHDHLVFLECEIVRYTSLGLLVNALRRWQKDPSDKTDKNASLDILSDDLHESWAYYMLTRRNRCRILSNLRQIFTSSHVAEGKFWAE